MKSAAVDARVYLKAQTDDLHQSLHRLAVFERLLDGSLSLPDYALLMRCFHDFYLDLDERVLRASDALSQSLGSYTYQPRAPMFATDIAALGSAARMARLAPSRHFSLPKIDCAARLAGVLYVVDGSVLGGMTMNKAAAALLPTNIVSGQSDRPGNGQSDGQGDGQGDGRSYWDWCRRHGATQWKSALAFVDVCWQVEQNQAIITSSAIQTFRALNDVLAPVDIRQPTAAA